MRGLIQGRDKGPALVDDVLSEATCPQTAEVIDERNEETPRLPERLKVRMP
jgi:hypothetical protein